MAFGAPIARAGENVFRLALGRHERETLRALPGELEALLADEPEDPTLRRLFPPAYADDPEGEAEYRRLVGDELAESRAEALGTLAETADRETLTGEELDAWVRALNDLRLVLGTRLDVREDSFDEPWDPRDPRAEELALYGYLSWLQEHAVAALAEGLSEGRD